MCQSTVTQKFMFHVQRVEFLFVDVVCLFSTGEEEEEGCQGRWIMGSYWRVIIVNWNSRNICTKEKCQLFHSYKSACFCWHEWITLICTMHRIFIFHCRHEKEVCLGLGAPFKRYIFHQAEYLSKTSLEAVNFPRCSKESFKFL